MKTKKIFKIGDKVKTAFIPETKYDDPSEPFMGTIDYVFTASKRLAVRDSKSDLFLMGYDQCIKR